MRSNLLTEAWAEGRRTANGWLAIPSSFAAEVMAHQGWDSLTIDLQHGVVDYQAAVGMLQAISTTAAVPHGARALARARHPHEDARRRRLRRDLPDDQHRDEAEPARARLPLPAARQRAASARSGPRSTAAPTMPGTPNDTVLVIAMIETAAGARQPRRHPRRRRAWTASMSARPTSRPRWAARRCSTRTSRGWWRRSSRSLAAAKAAGLCAGIHTARPAYARRMHELGFDFISIGSDSRLAGAQEPGIAGRDARRARPRRRCSELLISGGTAAAGRTALPDRGIAEAVG